MLAQLAQLARQLEGQRVLPVVGAGGSFDCGMRLARQLGQDLHGEYYADSRYAPHVPSLDPTLPEVTQAIHDVAGQTAVVEGLGLPDPALWPSAYDVDDHFCD